MMPRPLIVIAVLVTGAGWAQAQTQSLADLAREEAARRKTVVGTAKVYTNDDLRPDFTKPLPPPPPPGAAPAAGGPAHQETTAETAGAGQAPAGGGAVAGNPGGDQAYWAGRMAEARAKVDRSQAFAQALQNRIDMLWTDFVNRGDPVQQRAIEQERIKALAELDKVRTEIQDSIKAVAAVEDEARRAGVPAGWLRP